MSQRRIPRYVAAISVMLTAFGVLVGNVTVVDAQKPVAADVRPSPDARDKSVLARPVTIAFDSLTLREALRRVALHADVAIQYQAQVVNSVTKSITLHLVRTPLGTVLEQLLQGTKLRAALAGNDGVTIVPIDRADAGVDGEIHGVVKDVNTNRPIVGATVRVDGSKIVVRTQEDGTFRLPALSAGQYRITVRRLGYQLYSATIDVKDGEALALNVTLATSIARLNEVVTTAIGNQRRVEVGNVIAHINVDSIAPTAPITSVTDLLSSRAPGVQVIETNGLTGSGEAIRIRGQSSLVTSSDPILIVDGIRQDNTAGGGFSYLFQATSRPSRINDLDVSQIETIDILKGPTASTEYGTDAANGVIVITTKRGRPGAPQWRISGERAINTMPHDFTEYYASWGHLTDGSPVQCPLTSIFGDPAATSVTGPCTVDSVTHFNPLNHSSYSIYGTGLREKYDLSVGGGTDALRYFVAGGTSTEAGIAQLPAVFRAMATTLHLPDGSLNPNRQDQRSVRASTQIRLSSSAIVNITGAYLNTSATMPGSAGFAQGVIQGLVLSDSAHNYGYGCCRFYSPLSQVGQLQNDRTTRTTGGISTDWQPFDWLNARATSGTDHGSTTEQSVRSPQAAVAAGFGQNQGILEINQFTTDVYSSDARASATSHLSPGMRLVTSLGAQFAKTQTEGLRGSARGLSPANLTLNGTASPSIIQNGNAQATLGAYGEEQIAIRDKVFLTSALRVDAGSGFGHDYNATVYPKASISWLALNGEAGTIRLRGALGESGVQPSNGAALQLYKAGLAFGNGRTSTAARIATPGNPLLKPERSHEVEFGVDAGILSNRVNLELTQYQKTTNDALINVNAGWDFGNLGYQENLGQVENRGVEVTLTASVLQTRALTWDITVNASTNHNRLMHLAPGVDGSETIVNTYQRNVVGFPLYGNWGRQITYNDANHDHIIEATEVTMADSSTFMGPSLPTREVSLDTHVGLFNGTVSISTLFDYRGAYRVYNGDAAITALYGTSRERVDATAPLWLQARAAAVAKTDGNALNESSFFENGSLLRIRELSVTYLLPRSFARVTHSHEISVTGAVRNLALWTHYSGPDPEVSASSGGGYSTEFGTGLNGASNDLRSVTGAVPLTRYWMARLNIGL